MKKTDQQSSYMNFSNMRNNFFIIIMTLIFVLQLNLSWAAEKPTSTKAAASFNAKTIPTDQETSTLSLEIIDKQMAALSEEKSLSSEARSKLEEIWGKIRENFAQTLEWKAKEEEFRVRAENAPTLLLEIQRQLALPEPIAPENSIATFTVEMTEQLVNTLEAELKTQRDQFLELETAISAMTKRRLELPNLLADARSRLQGLVSSGHPTITIDEGPVAKKTRKAVANSQTALGEAEVKAYERQLATFETRLELGKSQRELISRRITETEEKLANLRAIFSGIKKRETEEANLKSQQELQEFARSLPAITSIAKENAEYASKRSEILTISEHVNNELDESTRKMAKLTEEHKSLEEKVKNLGLSDYIGLLFRGKRADLPKSSIYRDRIQRRNALISSIQAQLMPLEEKASGMYDLKKLQKELIQTLDSQLPIERREAVKQSLFDLLKTRRDLVDGLLKDYNSLFIRLADLDSLERRLLIVIRQFESFINKHIFWIPSCQSFSLQDITKAFSLIVLSHDPAAWSSLLPSITSAFKNKAWFFMGAIFLLLLILMGHGRAIAYNRSLAEQVGKPETDSFWLTIKSFLLTLYMTSFIPALIWFAYLLTSSGSEPLGMAKHVKTLLLAILPLTWALLFIRGVFREKGLANVHFKWHLEVVHDLLRSRLLWLSMICVPLYSITSVVLQSGGEQTHESLGRLLFLFSTILSAFFLHQIFSPSGKVFMEIGNFFPKRIFYRARHGLYFLVVILPIILCIISLFGYQFTAQQLLLRNIQGLFAILTAVFAYGFVTRALRLQRRKLASKLIQERAAAKNVEQNAEVAFISGKEVPLEHTDGTTIASMSSQADNLIFIAFLILLTMGLWNIWRDVLPAARILEQFQLWTTNVKVTEALTSADGSVINEVVERPVAVTLLDLLTALTVLTLSLVAARNVPGFLEFAILQRLPIDNGIRYAISSLTTYFITVLGIIWSFYLIGVGWDKVQWLVTGISVGLGFGMQEIFANFVSGLILLFERPMRVGDIVSVGVNSGLVTKIQIRATTILNHDKRELIIPNKNFITGEIINWTLTDRVIRIVLPVRVAYDSDLKRVSEILLRVASENPKVLKEPYPRALMTNFGENALEFELRVFVPSPDLYPEFQHDLNISITEAFRKEGIVIPFPQRDINVVPSKAKDKE